MSQIERLLEAYRKHMSLPWDPNLAGPQRVWFAVYDKTDERRLRLRIEDFGTATRQAGHAWTLLDLTDAFAAWMAAHEYRESYFSSPQDLLLALEDFEVSTTARLREVLEDPASDSGSVVAVLGAASLFGFMRISSLVQSVHDAIRGRLLVFFPGEYENNNYRLLDARDGWNYHAVPITAGSEV